jgi:UDP-glucose 4-epimerase
MILVTGGLGFIGAHTVRALLDLDQDCVAAGRQVADVPAFLADDVGDRLAVEPLDSTNIAQLLAFGDRYPIAGIVHLAAPALAANTISAAATHTTSLLNVLRAAVAWGGRLTVASSIGVYHGVDHVPFIESDPLPVSPTDPIPALKQAGEILTSVIAARHGLDVAQLRIATIWGPHRRNNEAPFSAIDTYLRRGTTDTADTAPVYADDARDVCYVKDCARAIALVQTAQSLQHRVYNVGSGRPTSNRDIAVAIHTALPDATVALTDGTDPDGTGRATWLDLTRIQADTDYQPRYDLQDAVADHVASIRSTRM